MKNLKLTWKKSMKEHNEHGYEEQSEKGSEVKDCTYDDEEEESTDEVKSQSKKKHRL